MKTAPELRPSNETDHDAIANIWHGSASLPGVGPAIMPTEAELRRRIDLELAAGWEVTVAVHGSEIIGFLAIKREEAVLAELFVRPGSLGAGVGRALLAHAMVSMPQGFSLFTRTTNERARRFYEKSGLVESHEGTHPRSGDPIVYYAWKAGQTYIAP
jgi:ribosomal protein S18 acetylase RimI-like enzyme